MWSRYLSLCNCYYSNLIEGHDTHPVDIDRALNDDYSSAPEKRDLQLEAKAHITVQAWIDNDGLQGPATSTENILAIHRRFGELLSGNLIWSDQPNTQERIRIIPGELRQHDVKVGRHIPVSPGALPLAADKILKVVLFRGEVPRGDVAGLLGKSERHARRITSVLLDRGVLLSPTLQTPLQLAFPAALAPRWTPGLFPEQ